MGGSFSVANIYSHAVSRRKVGTYILNSAETATISLKSSSVDALYGEGLGERKKPHLEHAEEQSTAVPGPVAPRSKITHTRGNVDEGSERKVGRIFRRESREEGNEKGWKEN